MNKPILIHFNQIQPIQLTVDTSVTVVGCVLAHIVPDGSTSL